MADRPPRVLQDGEAIDLGKGKRVRYIDTPHIPHGWEAGVLYEEATGTLLCGDLFTQLGDGPALTQTDIVGPAIVAEDMFNFSSLNPGMGSTIRRLAELSPRTLALMHGPSFSGDGAAALRSLADNYDRRILDRMSTVGTTSSCLNVPLTEDGKSGSHPCARLCALRRIGCCEQCRGRRDRSSQSAVTAAVRPRR